MHMSISNVVNYIESHLHNKQHVLVLGMSGLKRTPCIKCEHMCPDGGEKAEGMSRLSLPRLFVTLFVCPVERC